MRPNAYSDGPSARPMASSSTRRTFAPQSGGLSARTLTVSCAAVGWAAKVATTTASILDSVHRIPPPSLGTAGLPLRQARGLAIQALQHREEPRMLPKRIEHRVNARVNEPAPPLIDGTLDPFECRLQFTHAQAERPESDGRYVPLLRLGLELRADRARFVHLAALGEDVAERCIGVRTRPFQGRRLAQHTLRFLDLTHPEERHPQHPIALLGQRVHRDRALGVISRLFVTSRVRICLLYTSP